MKAQLFFIVIITCSILSAMQLDEPKTIINGTDSTSIYKIQLNDDNSILRTYNFIVKKECESDSRNLNELCNIARRMVSSGSESTTIDLSEIIDWAKRQGVEEFLSENKGINK